MFILKGLVKWLKFHILIGGSNMSFHFNLIRRSKNGSTQTYLIRTIVDGMDWYFFDFSKDDNTIIWTGKTSRATIFTTEKEVEDFKFAFFKNRTCDIVRL